MKIIPAIDVFDGQVVRLTEGDYSKKTTYKVSLDEMILQYAENGIDHIHIIDLNGAKGDTSNEEFIFNATRKNKLKIQLGGGIRTVEKIEKLFLNGIYRVIVGTVAVTDPLFLKLLKEKVDPEKVIIAIDILDEVIKYNGWLESSPIKLNEYIDQCLKLGYNRFLCTDISKDGKLQGSSISLYKKLLTSFNDISLIASGGISGMNDINELEEIKPESVVVGKAIYEGKISIAEISKWNQKVSLRFKV
jgi:phosphoribosylformimino-5-aminoimidazole carboxamide ribotide isomerase